MLKSAFLAAAALQAAVLQPDPLTEAKVQSLNAPVDPVHRTAPLSTEKAERLPLRELVDRSFGQLSDAVVSGWRPGGLAAGVALNSVDFMLQPTGAGIGGLCRSTQVTVRFGREQGPGTPPQLPEDVSTPRRAEDIVSRRLFKVIAPLHRLKTVEAQYAADAVCAQRRDVKSFMATHLPDENSLIPALIGIEQALEKRRQTMGAKANIYRLPPAFGGDLPIFVSENVASVDGIVDGERIPLLGVIFVPSGIDNGYGAKMTISNVTWHWPGFDSPDYGVPSVTIGDIVIEPYQVIYD